MFYTIYQITNNISGKIYIGQHQTENPKDSYYGSGIGIKNAIKKYGKDNFTKTVLFIYDTFDEMNNKEIELVTEEYISSDRNYNMSLGGAQFAVWTDEARARVRKNNEKTNKSRGTKVRSALTGKSKSKEHVANIKRAAKGLRVKGIKRPKYIWTIQCPDQTIVAVTNLTDFCKMHSLNRNCIVRAGTKGYAIISKLPKNP